MNSVGKCILKVLRSHVVRLKSSHISSKLCVRFLSSTSQNTVIPHPYSVMKLQELFDLRQSVAYNILLSHNKFADVSVNEIDKTFNACISAGIKKDVLQRHIEVLTITEVDGKINLMKELHHDVNITVPLLLLDTKLLRRFVSQEQSEKRIHFLSKLFEVKIY